MQKHVKRIVIKTIIFIIVCVVVKIIIGAIEPTFNNDIAIQQLNGGDYEYAQMNVYNSLKSYAPIGYIVFALIVFGSDVIKGVKYLLTKKEN